MKLSKFFAAANVIAVLLLMSSCALFKPVQVQPVPTQVIQDVPVTGLQYYFVTNQLLLPTTQAQTKEFGLNIDRDSQNSLDNKFGDLLTLLTSAAPNLELQETLAQSVNTGQLVTLHVVQANDPLNDPSVSWSLFLGQSTQSSPAFDGSDQLTLEPTAPIYEPIVGSLANGHFAGGPGKAHIKIVLLGQSVEVDMIGVYLESDVNAQGCTNGKIGGGVTSDQLRGNLLPAIAVGLNQITKADKAAAKTLLPIFDTDGNGTITSKELESNPLLMIAISPDLDLLDASGNFNPNQDGVKDSYSIGLGFSCVPASFAVPVK